MSNRIEDYTDTRKKRADRLASYRQVKGATRWTDAKDAAFMNIAHGQDGQEKKDAFMAIREQMKQTKMKRRSEKKLEENING